MIIKALVAARSGSQRVINKNIRPFADSTLLDIKLKQLNRLKGLDGVILNSDDDDILKIGKKHRCELFRRDPYYASNSISMSEVYKNMAENCECDIIAYINCTNPLILDNTLELAIQLFLKNMDKFDSLNSAHLIKEFLFKDNRPINYDLKHQPRSQDLPDIAALNFAVNIIKREDMIKYMNVVGEKPFIYIIDEIEATDIDNQIDFDFAEFVYQRRSKNSN